MAEIVTMLALSPTMEEGQLVRWAKAEGDEVEEGEIIAEVETDKAAMEMESFFDGVVLKILVEAGNPVKVGAPIAIIGEAGEDISEVLSETAGGGAAPAPAPEASAAAPSATPATATPAAATASTSGRVLASPVAKNMAREHGLDLSAIRGSGPNGRVIKRDVEAAMASGTTSRTQSAAVAAPASAGGTVVPLTQMRKTIAARMTSSWTSAPHFALTTEIDMGPAMALRKQINTDLAAADAGIKLSVNDFILKSCALALRQVPDMNVAWGGDHVIRHDEVHIGVAVAIDGGLITPVVRNADQKSLGTISQEVRDMAGRARVKKLMPHEYTGSTFSLSNLGMFGVTSFQAVLNPPEAGILAAGAVVKKPVVEGDKIVPGLRMEVTLSCDHRSSDGAVGARFLQAVKLLLEHPSALLVI